MNAVSGAAATPEVEAFVADVLAGRRSGVTLGNHRVELLPGTYGSALVVCFEPAADEGPAVGLDRPVWGEAFLSRRGHTILGVKRVASDWYRNPALHRLFRRLQAQGWFERFERVMFYGPSMGGYAALAFSAVAPGCTVLALNPQSTLAPDRVWFDQRFSGSHAAAWKGDFVDGADGAASAARVYVCYDPWHLKDRLHAQRLPRRNRVDLRLPFGGHATAQTLQSLTLLGSVVDKALEGTLDESTFRDMARARAQLPEYWLRLSRRGLHVPRQVRCLERALFLRPDHPAALAALGRLDATALLRHLPAKGAPHAQASELVEPAAAELAPLPPLPQFAPVVRGRRWPPGMVSGDRLPLVYLQIPKAASTTIQNHLLFMLTGRYAADPSAIYAHPGLARSQDVAPAVQGLFDRQIASGALVFTFVRDPGVRAYACFNDKFMHAGPHSFAAIRESLVRDWGLHPPAPGQAATLEQQQQNFHAFLQFVEANLAGQTHIRQDLHWAPQAPQLARFRRHVKIGFVGRVEDFASDMAWVLHRSVPRRLPDLQFRPWRHPAAAYPFEQVVTPEIQATLDRVYAADYAELGYRPGRKAPPEFDAERVTRTTRRPSPKAR